jgi:hypothetical protein
MVITERLVNLHAPVEAYFARNCSITEATDTKGNLATKTTPYHRLRPNSNPATLRYDGHRHLPSGVRPGGSNVFSLWISHPR